MTRSQWKSPFFQQLKQKHSKLQLNRAVKIGLNYVNKSFWLHNGKSIELKLISYFQVGLTAGELYLTRGLRQHRVNKRRNKKKSTKKK